MERRFSYTTLRAECAGELELADYKEDVALLHGALFELDTYGPDYEDRFIGELEGSLPSWVAVVLAKDENEDVIGYGSLSAVENHDDVLELSFAYVKPESRQNGVYKALFNKRLELAKELGAKSVYIQIIDQTFHGDFLVRQGFERFCEDDPDAVMYRRDL